MEHCSHQLALGVTSRQVTWPDALFVAAPCDI